MRVSFSNIWLIATGLALFIQSLIAGQTPSVCVAVMRKLSPYNHGIALGDRVKIQFSDVNRNPIEGTFLGVWHEEA